MRGSNRVEKELEALMNWFINEQRKIWKLPSDGCLDGYRSKKMNELEVEFLSRKQEILKK